MKLNELTIEQAIGGLKERNFNSRQLVEACLKVIEEQSPKLNAFITVCGDEAVRVANDVDRLLDKETSVDSKPLLGIPIAIKDIFCTKNIKTTAGSNVLADYVPAYDATVIQRLKEAGAIIVGKTNLDAWAHGSSGENSDFGPSKNPWNPDYVPGGSSSGSAVAVSTGMSLAATGTDTGGSIRLPASFCNLVGLKPTYGRVPRYGIIAMASSFDSVGHLTQTVTDSAIVLKVTAGQDGKDATCPDVPVEDYLKDLKKGVNGLKIGLPKEYFTEGLDKKLENKVKEAIVVFRELDAEIVEISLPHTSYAIATYYILVSSEISSNLARYDGIRYGFGRDKFGDEAVRRIMLGTYALSAGYYDAYYLKAMQVRTLIKKDFDNVFESVDCILAPVSPTPPFKLGERKDDPLKMYLSDIFTVTANLAGLPGLALPAGFVDGLPVGIQLLGPQFSEKLLFRAGFAFEHATKYFQKKPNI